MNFQVSVTFGDFFKGVGGIMSPLYDVVDQLEFLVAVSLQRGSECLMGLI
jgi:hypothetical protein